MPIRVVFLEFGRQGLEPTDIVKQLWICQNAAYGIIQVEELTILIIEWKTKNWNGGRDFLPSHWFEQEGEWSHRSHIFRNPNGRRYTARCSVTVKGRVVEIGYDGEHRKYNEQDSDIGTLRLTFADEARRGDPSVEWRYAKSGGTFKAYEIEICQSDMDRSPPPAGVFDEEDRREFAERSVAVRRGQPAFRDALMDAYERRCAISECEIEEVLEAAHIRPFMGEHTNQVTNGLLLRADIHTLFDCGLITVDADYSINAPRHIRDHYQLRKMLSLPSDPAQWPDATAFTEKWANQER